HVVELDEQRRNVRALRDRLAEADHGRVRRGVGKPVLGKLIGFLPRGRDRLLGFGDPGVELLQLAALGAQSQQPEGRDKAEHCHADEDASIARGHGAAPVLAALCWLVATAPCALAIGVTEPEPPAGAAGWAAGALPRTTRISNFVMEARVRQSPLPAELPLPVSVAALPLAPDCCCSSGRSEAESATSVTSSMFRMRVIIRATSLCEYVHPDS